MQSEDFKSTDVQADSALEPQSSETQAIIARQMQDVESLIQDFRKLLVRYELPLAEEGVRERLETLERWAESFRRGLKAAAKISELGPLWLHEAQDKLKLAADELHRMDAESPAPGGADQAKKADDYMRATRRIEKLIPAVDHAMTQSQEPIAETTEPKEADHVSAA